MNKKILIGISTVVLSITGLFNTTTSKITDTSDVMIEDVYKVSNVEYREDLGEDLYIAYTLDNKHIVGIKRSEASEVLSVGDIVKTKSSETKGHTEVQKIN